MIVLGLNYGDEGKGLTTSYLCSQAEHPLVLRFNGGHQAGHTVVHNGIRHIFQSFGSGTLQGAPTYWSKNCTIYPTTLIEEHRVLMHKSSLYVDPLCPITTPFDVRHNRNLEEVNGHGSVGLGFGATVERQEGQYKLYAQDLFYDSVLEEKLYAIANSYKYSMGTLSKIKYFMADVKRARDIIILKDFDDVKHKYNIICEGAQGILLDKDYGFFPNVTRSNTTSKNALEMHDAKDVYYVTRSYLTRHGNGYMPNEKKLKLVNNEQETNKSHKYQGELRFAHLNIELMNYALACDKNFSKGLNKHLIITCIDQHPIDVIDLLDSLDTDFEDVHISEGNSLTDITLVT